jgi:hypothetical protein
MADPAQRVERRFEQLLLFVNTALLFAIVLGLGLFIPNLDKLKEAYKHYNGTAASLTDNY